MEKKKVTTMLPDELAREIKAQAAKEGRPLSELLEELIREYLAKQQ